MSWSSEPDLENRDPNNLNAHLAVAWEDKFGEPEATRSIACVWRYSYKCFNLWKNLCYIIATTICGIPIAMCWGCTFACIAFCHIWKITEGALDSSGSFGGLTKPNGISRRGSIELLDMPGTPIKNPQIRRILNGDAASIGTMAGSVIGARLTEGRPSLADIAQLSMTIKGPKDLAKTEKKHKKLEQTPSLRGSVWEQHSQVLTSINRFRIQEKKAVIDVWWLFDDGGLTLFIPHMLTLPKSYLEGAKLRVFTIASKKNAIEQEQRSMIFLLNKFRIDYQDVFLIPDITRKPKPETLKEFEQLIKPFKAQQDSPAGYINDAELRAMEQKTYRQLRTRELLLQHSCDANLVVLTLPIPREGTTSPYLYMAWLEMLTRGMPPMLLLRGNQQSVLTFYS